MLFFQLYRYAVERMNHNKKILTSTRLSAQVEKIAPKDSFHASKRGEFNKETASEILTAGFLMNGFLLSPYCVQLMLQTKIKQIIHCIDSYIRDLKLSV
jgi:hypothetical protein